MIEEFVGENLEFEIWNVKWKNDRWATRAVSAGRHRSYVSHQSYKSHKTRPLPLNVKT